AVLYMALLDVRPCITHRAGGVLEQRLPLRRRHFTEQVARLLPVIIIHAMIPMRPVAVHRHRRFGEIGLIVPEPGAVGMEGERAAQITVRPHLPVAVIAVIRAFRPGRTGRGTKLDFPESDPVGGIGGPTSRLWLRA